MCETTRNERREMVISTKTPLVDAIDWTDKAWNLLELYSMCHLSLDYFDS